MHNDPLSSENFVLLIIQDGDSRHLENRKTAITQQRFDRSALNLARWRILTFWTGQAVKIWTFKNPSWRTAAILKYQKWPYFCNGLTNLHKICNVDAYWHSEPPQHWKFRSFKMEDGRHYGKLKNGHNSATDWLICTKFGIVTHVDPRNQTGS